jgi:hypothetical protein
MNGDRRRYVAGTWCNTGYDRFQASITQNCLISTLITYSQRQGSGHNKRLLYGNRLPRAARPYCIPSQPSSGSADTEFCVMGNSLVRHMVRGRATLPTSTVVTLPETETKT